ncbi:DUF6809 family protein [Clostridium botulinum]|uniref:DUF6809 family protein n=1 Tax=Clostridium botulinum TaxID=1491 RepID=UPI0007DEDC5F|nr:DUF6809 family protein [Clostridium botulinum]KEI96358.1 hypothetical protein N497_17575 [Clostridium botulinum F 357]
MSIKHNFNDMVHQILEEYSIEISQNDNYKKLVNEYDKVFEKISKCLSKENREMIYKLNEIEGNMSSISEKMIYEKGLKDGIELKNIVKIVS